MSKRYVILKKAERKQAPTKIRNRILTLVGALFVVASVACTAAFVPLAVSEANQAQQTQTYTQPDDSDGDTIVVFR